MIEARVPPATTSPGYELSELNQADHASATRIQTVDSEEQNHELSQAGNLEGNGVLYNKQGTEESLMDGSQEVVGEKNLVDPSISCHTAIEEL